MAHKHTQELALDKCAISLTPKLELKYKVLVKTKYKMTAAKAFIALAEEATKNVKLTKAELDAIRTDMKLAYDKRMRNRIKVAAFNRGLSEEAFRRREGI